MLCSQKFSNVYQGQGLPSKRKKRTRRASFSSLEVSSSVDQSQSDRVTETEAEGDGDSMEADDVSQEAQEVELQGQVQVSAEEAEDAVDLKADEPDPILQQKLAELDTRDEDLVVNNCIFLSRYS